MPPALLVLVPPAPPTLPVVPEVPVAALGFVSSPHPKAASKSSIEAFLMTVVKRSIRPSSSNSPRKTSTTLGITTAGRRSHHPWVGRDWDGGPSS